MANYATLKAAVQAVVKSNGMQSITGANLQSTLISMIESLGANYTFAGVATTSTSPGTPDQNVFYVGGAGTYTNFGSSYTVPVGSIGVFAYNGSWSRINIEIFGLTTSLTDGNEGMALDASRGKYLQDEIEYISRNKAEKSWQQDKKFSIADEQGYSIFDLDENGDFCTSKFNTRHSLQSSFSLNPLEISDEQGNAIVKIDNEGQIESKGFNSRKINGTFAEMDFCIADENGNVILSIENGNIKTRFFDSSRIQNTLPEGVLKYPELPIPIYITNNNLDTSNRWGIGSRNKSLNVFLDHFFHTDHEIGVKFNDGCVYHTISQKIVGNGSSQGWNNNETKYEYLENLSVGEETIPVKVRSILNSETIGIKPIVLQIGDSVTEGWFANYPSVQGAPIQSWSWAKYYFEKDKAQNGSGYDSLFVGSRTSNTVNYDGISYKSYAYGWGGKTAKWFCTGNDSPFNSGGSFSLTAYLNKYKTLADDGVTRLVAGSTAGTEVVDVYAWDLCTPNVVVIQLGMNDILSEWKVYMPQIVGSIKSEFQDMKIIISVLDACTCNYPSLYPNYEGIFFDDYNSDHTKLLDAYCYAIDNWQDESNGVYVIYSGAVMPMPYCCNVRETEGEFDGKEKRYIGVDSIERVPHPSRYGHQEMGYMLYSAIKWILT